MNPHAPLRALGAALALSLAPVLAAAQDRPLTLADAIALAQARSHPASAARAAREASRYRNGAFDARQLPQLSLTGLLPQYNRSIIPVTQPDGSVLFQPQQQTSGNLGLRLTQKIPGLGGDLFFTSSLSTLQRIGQTSTRSWSSTPFSVGLRQEILRPNALRWDRREQEVRIDRDERAYLESMEDVAVQTTELFFAAYAAQVAFQNATTNAAVNDTLYRINTGRYDIGRIGENDLLQSELALLRARTARETAELEYRRALEALRLGLNLPVGTDLSVAVSTAITEYAVDTAQAVAQARRNRSTVAETELQQVQASRAVTQARLGGGPGATITATYGYNQTGPEVSSVYKDLLDSRQLTVSVEMPLWNFGARRGEVRAAEADREAVVARNTASLEQLEHEARFAAMALVQAYRNVGLLAKADTVAGRRYEVAYNRYVIGRITLDNLFIAQNEKDAALGQFVGGLRAFWAAHYRLRRATLYDFLEGRPIR